MIVTGLTGGIATGKSTVSKILEEAGAAIVDADLIARQAVEKGMPAWHQIVDWFGSDILLPSGIINRNRLGNIIFNDPSQKEQLNRIVHPHVFEAIQKETRHIGTRQPDALVVQDIPLLIESGMHNSFAYIIVVYIPESLQLERLMARDQLSREDALARIHSQMPIEEKKKRADIVIDNSGSLADTRERVLELYTFLKKSQSNS